MDAVEFLKTRTRMCNDSSCERCTLKFFCESNFQEQSTSAEKAVSVVEQWAKEHPVKTRQSEFLKQWPNAEIGDDGYPSVAPCQLYEDMEEKGENGVCCKNCGCAECRRDFWLKEIE